MKEKERDKFINGTDELLTDTRKKEIIDEKLRN